MVRIFVLMKSRTSMKLGHVGSKSRLLGRIFEKPCVCSRATFSVQYSCNLIRMFALRKSRTRLKLGHVGSKTRSLGQMLEKPCVGSRGQIFSWIPMKPCHQICLDESSNKFEIVSFEVQN